jgi:hypothetical protein
VLGHVEPAATFSPQESQEFLKVSQLMEMRCRSRDVMASGSLDSTAQLHGFDKALMKGVDGQFPRAGGEGGAVAASAPGKEEGAGAGPGKRSYRVWLPWERYTVCLGIATYGGTKGTKINKIRALLDGRNESQVS